MTLVASSVGVTAINAAAIGVRLRSREVASLIVLAAGLLMLDMSAQPEQGEPIALSYRWALLASVVLLGAAGVIAARHGGRSSAPALALLAGLAFTAVAVSARSLTLPSPLWHTLVDPGLWVSGG